ncbi:NCS1 nucleoside transporter family protein [Cordyceps fumosorosea ARSEF 2679]|uniref:NCS1 nucleoside transporter family protein n=1 Tax=Cordyceps fumosorosea (strain ARSEF 2679) TaxID=1081104 RepID=A0A168B7T9_CORFA|nr:NCS1 nucleoside transporter family protein [Cordyceps fumosorosea ARSEF 2679]OAA69741.1 NCS1 nucleoside transporter family protein [Cordyceps fumosorosea ARSEF 2679]
MSSTDSPEGIPSRPRRLTERLSALMAAAELPSVSQWINDDVRPVEKERRTWNLRSFHDLWLVINCNTTTFITGSALIPLGLSWWQAVICIVVGNLIALAAILASSTAGSRYHIGFPVISRSVWGMWGSQFTIWNRIFLSIVWSVYASQSWTGGQCFHLIVLALDPKVDQHIPNTMPRRAHLTTARFMSYVIFCVISLPFIWSRPHRLQWFLNSTSLVALVFYIALLIWALATMGPSGFGSTITEDKPNPPSGPNSTAWVMVSGIVATVGSIAAGILNQSDYTRLARKPRDAKWGQIIAYPIYSIGTSIIGILVVAATQDRLGKEHWFLPGLLARVVRKYPTPGARAGVFFSGLALTFSQLGSNVLGNALAGGIDLSAVFPRYINIRRGAYITAIISPIVNPWRMVDTASIFISVMSAYGVFLAPMTGIMVASYFVVHRQKLDVDDLFRGDPSSKYWYSHGVNWRAPISWALGVGPCLPGFVASVNSSVNVPDSIRELYMTNYLYGFFSSGLVFVALHMVFPVRAVDEFVKNEMTAAEVQRYFGERWDVSLAESGRMAMAKFEDEEKQAEDSRSDRRGAEPVMVPDASERRRRSREVEGRSV